MYWELKSAVDVRVLDIRPNLASMLRDDNCVLKLGAGTTSVLGVGRLDLFLVLLGWRVALELLGTFGSDCMDLEMPTDIQVLLSGMSVLNDNIAAGVATASGKNLPGGVMNGWTALEDVP